MRTTAGWIALVFLTSTLGSFVLKAQDEQHPTEAKVPSQIEPHQAKAGEQPKPALNDVDSKLESVPPAQVGRPNVTVQVDQRSEEADRSSVGGWLRFLLGLLLPWPFLIIVVLLYLLSPTNAPSRVEDLLRPFQSLKLFGQEFVLNPQGGRNAEAAINFFRKEVQKKLDARIKKMKLRRMHEDIVQNYVAKLIPEFDSLGIRSTIHIPDSLFAETLYQLVNYYPKQLDSGRGRTFSTRFGIIGQAWRLAESKYAPAVPTTQEELILRWGMTQEEAQRAALKERQSFACVIVKNRDGNCLAVFYLDSPSKDAFGSEDAWKKIEAAILEGASETKLTDALDQIYADFLSVGPRVHIYSSAHMASK